MILYLKLKMLFYEKGKNFTSSGPLGHTVYEPMVKNMTGAVLNPHCVLRVE